MAALMLEVADIFRLHGPAYRDKFGDRMLPSHRRAMQDIETCRTESLGGQLYFCTQCQAQRYSYHSCKNRHCPKCQNQQANDWLAAQQNLLLPIHHFLVTFTLPEELRALARSHQKLLYNLLFRASHRSRLFKLQVASTCNLTFLPAPLLSPLTAPTRILNTLGIAFICTLTSAIYLKLNVAFQD